MMSSLQTAGFAEPFPVTASNEEELIQILERWMTSHPDEKPPGSTRLQNQECSRKFRYAKELTFGSTYEPVWVERVRISVSHMAFFLMDDNGSCMLAIPNCTNNNGWRGYHGWLGADLGFTLQTIAQTGSAVKWHPGGLIDNIQPADSGNGGVAQVLHLSELNEDEQSIEKTVSIRSWTAKAERQVTIKEEPRRTSTRHADMQRNQIERQTDEERWRYETPPLSSLDVVKKRRWPAQYVSPPPTSQSQKHLRGDKKLPKASKSSTLQISRHKRCSSPGLTSVGPAFAKHEVTQSGNLDGNNLEKSKGRPRKKARKETADTPQMPISPVSPFSLASVNRAIPEPAPKANVTLHFFLQRRELGALPTPIAQCDTADKFFNHAEEAWGFLTLRDGASEMAAVSVEVDGVEWPMVIPWRDPLAHQWMMETIAKAAIGRSLDLHVQVKCITK